MAHVPAKFHPDIFNIKTKLDNAYNNNNKEDKIQLFQDPIPLQGEWDNYRRNAWERTRHIGPRLDTPDDMQPRSGAV